MNEPVRCFCGLVLVNNSLHVFLFSNKDKQPFTITLCLDLPKALMYHASSTSLPLPLCTAQFFPLSKRNQEENVFSCKWYTMLCTFSCFKCFNMSFIAEIHIQNTILTSVCYFWLCNLLKCNFIEYFFGVFFNLTDVCFKNCYKAVRRRFVLVAVAETQFTQKRYNRRK